MRAFIVTFAGTVLANVVTVMVIAVAVIIARPSISGQPRTASSILAYTGLGVLFTLVTAGSVSYWRRRHQQGRQRRTGWLVTGLVSGFLGLLCIMALLGDAYGVK